MIPTGCRMRDDKRSYIGIDTLTGRAYDVLKRLYLRSLS